MRISRTGVDKYCECPRCFHLQYVKGIKRPPGYPFSLNNTVDALLKKEFDAHRAAGTQHPVQFTFGTDLRPAQHEQINRWRANRSGVEFVDEHREITWFGAIDDLWIDSQGLYYVVDYKATGKLQPVLNMDPDWMSGYKRQAEFYQFLLRKNGLEVSDRAYFLYCTGDRSRAVFNEEIKFHSELIAYDGSTEWIESTLDQVVSTLALAESPAANEECNYCKYVNERNSIN